MKNGLFLLTQLVLGVITLTGCEGITSEVDPEVALGDKTTTIAWQTPTHKADGSPLDDLSGYVIYYGSMDVAYANKIVINDPSAASYLVPNLSENFSYYFAVTAINNQGYESAMSNVVIRDQFN